MKNKKFWKGFYVVMFLLGAASIIFEISIYRHTLIEVYIPILIIVVVGLIAFFFNRSHYKRTYELSGNFFPLLQNLISWGFISCYIFMAANFYLAEQATTEYRYDIKEKKSMPGPKWNRRKRVPLVKIDLFGIEKELVFDHTETDNVGKADSVMVSIKKGGLGFKILDKYQAYN
ncbi:MAG: hypothetical protein REI78_13825 [Pedobacter sp.]|nr:hypothetical protein [Pedobacter sp.]MDQ8054108.1 hypothetical protein [Pedobacter sp.]